MTNFVKRFVKDESGATSIEYGLIGCLLSVAIITILTSSGKKMNTTFKSIDTALH